LNLWKTSEYCLISARLPAFLTQFHPVFSLTVKEEQQCPSDDQVIEEYLDECFDDQDFEGLPFISVDSTKLSLKTEDVKPKISAIHDHQYTVTEIDETGAEMEVVGYDDENGETYTFEELPINEETVSSEQESYDENGKRISKKQYHKFHQLTGKAACKYCETIFKSKEMLKLHVCKYLQCDPKNFICRICNKELSRKTFSNHLHETTDCQYCGKSFVNPRNLKTHIKNLHKDESFLPPKSPDKAFFKELEIDETENQMRLDEETGIITAAAVEKEKKKYIRKKGRYECDLCGRIFSMARSLTQHLLLHSKTYRYVCETCGEKFTTRTGIIKHACLNRKRKRPEKDFRTVDVRHCKYCDLWFESYEENKSHDCNYQMGYDPKMFKCRFCFLEMSKNSYNKVSAISFRGLVNLLTLDFILAHVKAPGP
jgi:predicted nucleic acid-binding Zn ribbon protein